MMPDRHSIAAQLLAAAGKRIGELYCNSVLGKVPGYSSSLLTRWIRGSLLHELLWRRDNVYIWRHSLFGRLAEGGGAVLRARLDKLSQSLRRSRDGSMFVRLWDFACLELKNFGGAARMPVKPLLDFGLAFLAANVLLRLVLQSYSACSLLFFCGAILVMLLLRQNAGGVESALQNSRCVRLAASLFSLCGGGAKEVK